MELDPITGKPIEPRREWVSFAYLLAYMLLGCYLVGLALARWPEWSAALWIG
jgi:hypothetical protein